MQTKFIVTAHAYYESTGTDISDTYLVHLDRFSTVEELFLLRADFQVNFGSQISLFIALNVEAFFAHVLLNARNCGIPL